MKKFLFYGILLISGIASAQKITFEIRNDSIDNTFSIESINKEIVKTITIKELNFEVNNLDLQEGYYSLNKEEHSVILYLKRSDDFTISFDAENFYKSLVFIGKGAERNTYLLNRRQNFIDYKGRLQEFYKKGFYRGDENEYLNRLDDLYKGFYSAIFSDRFEKGFKDEEMKNLQYAYFLDLLRFKEAKKHHQYKDSIVVSANFLEPLKFIDFDNSELYKRYDSYNKVCVLKFKKDVEKAADFTAKNSVIESIRSQAIREEVLKSLYEELPKDKEQAKELIALIKENTTDLDILFDIKERDKKEGLLLAEKNLSKFNYKNIKGDEVKLSAYKGNYIFVSAWASFCKDCVNQFEEMKKIRKKFADKKIVFVGISLDGKEKYDTWVETVTTNNIEGEQLFFNESSKSKFINKYKISSIPSFFMLSLKGEPMEHIIEDPTSKETKKFLSSLFK